jgi:DNA helicase-2/ATP-dependent DNA helicase PcrA
MRERLERLIGPEQAHKLTAGTFHSTCVRILRRDGHPIGVDPRFTIYDDVDQIDAVRQALKALDLDPKQYGPRPILSRISKAKSQFIGPERFAEQVESYWEEIAARVYEQYQQILKRNRALDFDDLLGEALRLLEEQPDVLRRYQEWYRYVLVDEYQDTNRVQYLLVRALTSTHRNLCVVGDPDQSIYGWRQADIRNILDFKRDYPEASEVHLEMNYRSTGSIVEAADHVIRANRQRIDRRLRTENPLGDRIVIRESYDEEEEAQFVVSEIRRLRLGGRYQYRDVAVMYRTNAQSRSLEEAFVRSEIPYQIVGGTRFYERAEIKDAMAILRLIANPSDTASLQRLIRNTRLGKGVGAKTMAQIDDWSHLTGQPAFEALAALDGYSRLAPPEVGRRAAKALVDIHATISRLHEESDRMNPSELFDRAVDKTGFAYQFRDGGDPDLLERWDNVLQLRNVLTSYDALPEADALQTFLEESALIADADMLDDCGNQVALITLHAAKGLEFPVVFLVGAEEGILPHARSMDSDAQLEEERRLFYVGVTRTKERLYVTHAFRRTVFGSPDITVRSRFVDAIPKSLIESKNVRPAARSALATPVPLPSVASRPMTHFTAGERVFHDRFGDGRVVSVRTVSDDQEVTIDFKRHGQKRLLASLANLQRGEPAWQ